MDFRKLMSPQFQAEIAQRHETLAAFQELAPAEMAEALLGYSRTLIDSGAFSADQRYSYDEWALYRVVPEVALALDPEVKLRETENPADAERDDMVTYLRGGPVERLAWASESIMSNGSFRRAGREGFSPDAKEAADILFGHAPNAFSIAIDTVKPGTAPKRCEPDDRPPVSGFYVIGISDDGLHKERHSVIKHCDDVATAIRYLDVATLLTEGNDIPDTHDDVAAVLQGRTWKLNRDHIQFQVQAPDGRVMRYRFVEKADADLSNGPTP